MHHRIQLFCGNMTRDTESGRDCFSAAGCHLFSFHFHSVLFCFSSFSFLLSFRELWHILTIKSLAKRSYYSYYFKFIPNSCYDYNLGFKRCFFSLFFFPSGLIHMEIMTFDPDDPSKTAVWDTALSWCLLVWHDLHRFATLGRPNNIQFSNTVKAIYQVSWATEDSVNCCNVYSKVYSHIKNRVGI